MPDGGSATQDDGWATLDELLGLEAVAAEVPAGEGIGRLAFYGRCSTEDNQDPKTSWAWQLAEARRFVEPLGGEIVSEYFDIGQSRSLPWERRGQANLLLEQLRFPRRGWSGLVVGEATRCWFDNQFSLTWPKFDRYGVSLWIPSLGGQFDPQNPAHGMAMAITGGLSKSERQHVQRRVRAAMAAQVLIDGKHQGGRAPYGYRVADAGPHPNPRKAQEGYRLRVLEIDEEAAPIVEKIFSLYLDGIGLKAIAETLNREAIACPSAHTPKQNRHRSQDGWQHATVNAIVDNPRYSGYAVYGRWQKVEELLDPDDVAAGYTVRLRRSPQAKVVRSREPAHPAIVSVETFTQAQLRRRGRRATGVKGWSSLERHRTGGREYLLRGRLRCGICERKMEGSARKKTVYYRCNARSLVPGSQVAMEHPTNVYLREGLVVPAVNSWLARLFDHDHRASTLEALVDADDTGRNEEVRRKALREQVAEADAAMTRLQKALEAGWDPVELREQYNGAVARKREAEAALKSEPERGTDRHELEALVDRIADMTEVLDQAEPADLAELYAALDLTMTYHHTSNAVDVAAAPSQRGVKSGVRGGT